MTVANSPWQKGCLRKTSRSRHDRVRGNAHRHDKCRTDGSDPGAGKGLGGCENSHPGHAVPLDHPAPGYPIDFRSCGDRRNFPTEMGVLADAKLAPRGPCPRTRAAGRPEREGCGR